MSANYRDLLKYAATGIASPSMTYYDRMRASMLMGGAVQTLTGIPPLSFKSDGTPLTSVTIKGNGQQSGTPSPQSIIIPTFCGVRTAQLFDKDNATIYSLYPGIGDIIRASSNVRSIAIPCVGGEIYTVSKKPGERFIVCFTTEPIASQVAYTDAVTDNKAASITVVAPSNAKFLFVYFYNRTADTEPLETLIDSIMINLGSTALPYESYGWSEKITCAGQTTPVYLGEVPTVRRIKKLVLTGKENWQIHQENYYISVANYYNLHDIGINLIICSHFENRQELVMPDGYYGLGGLIDKNINTKWNGNIVFNPKPLITTKQDWMNYLAAQYVAGTPVTVWYVLAEPETGIVNEPLMKIGDYADTLTTDTPIPTAKGTNTLTVDTTVQPSEVSITGNIKPTT